MSMTRQQKQNQALANEALLRAAIAAGGVGNEINAVFSRVGALGPAHSVEFDAPTIAPIKSGQFLVMFNISGTDATPSDTITAVLGRGLTSLLTETFAVGADAAGTWFYSVTFLDESGGGGIYKLTLTSNTPANITVPANHGCVQVIEQP